MSAARHWLLIFDDGHRRLDDVFCEQEPPLDWSLHPERAGIEQRYRLTGDWHRIGFNALARIAAYLRWEAPNP